MEISWRCIASEHHRYHHPGLSKPLSLEVLPPSLSPSRVSVSLSQASALPWPTLAPSLILGWVLRITFRHWYQVRRIKSSILSNIALRVAQLVAAWQPGCGKMEREWENEEEMERGWGNGEGFTLYISSFSLYFLPLYPFSISKIVSFCRKTLNTALLSRMSQKIEQLRYEKIILGRIRCEKAPQVVRAWQGNAGGD